MFYNHLNKSRYFLVLIIHKTNKCCSNCKYTVWDDYDFKEAESKKRHCFAVQPFSTNKKGFWSARLAY